MWYEHYHSVSIINKAPQPSIYVEVIDWLDDNVGWTISDNNRYLPYYGYGWRIDINRSNDENRSGIALTIDDDSHAVMYKLKYGDHCG
jgi:hypothetical protein